MKIAYYFLSALLVPMMVQASDDPYLTKTFTLSSPGNLEVNTSGGSIDVVGTSGNQVTIEMYVKPNGGWSLFGSDDDDIEEALEDYSIDIRQEGFTVIATAERQGSNWGNSKVSISFKVMVPTSISCDLSTSGGSISVADVEGEHDIRTSGGSLNFDRLSGTTEAHTSGGSINVNDYQGKLDANTSGGSIRVDGSEGEAMLKTSGGSINLENIRGSLEARTSGGSIRADVEELGKFLTLRTSGGGITATIPGGQGLDLDLSGNRVNTKLVNFTGESDKNSINGSVNGGGVPVNLHTSGGSVTLDYQGM
ncbi:MAG: hypothetical protein WA960_06160 [Tunicatimonas sp.]